MSVLPSKTCTKCGQSKSLDEFHNEPKSSDGKAWYCKACIKAYNAARAVQPKIVLAEKACRKCGVPKAIEEFGFDKSTKDGYATRCFKKAFINAQNTARHAARQWEHHNHSTDIIAGVNDLSTAQVLELRLAYASLCQYCEKLLEEGQHSIDHVFPLSRGGPNTLSNVVLACRACNSKKHSGAPLRPVFPLLVTVALPKTPKKKGS